MIVVSDATSITTLLKAGKEGLLRELFRSVTIPHAVRDELLAFHSRLPDFVVCRAINNPHRLQGTETLGRGEAEAIRLAGELGADLFLTDDRKARAAAAKLNIKSAGLLGLLVHAKHAGRIVSVGSMIDTLENRGGLYLSREVKDEALRLAGEL